MVPDGAAAATTPVPVFGRAVTGPAGVVVPGVLGVGVAPGVLADDEEGAGGTCALA